MFKLKQVLKDISTLFLMLQVYGDDIKQLKAEVALLKPKKKASPSTVNNIVVTPAKAPAKKK
jgi:hypothetical protein